MFKVRINGRKIREFARANRWNARTLALAAGLNPATVQRMFHSQTDLLATNLGKICRVLGISMDEVFEYSENENDDEKQG